MFFDYHVHTNFSSDSSMDMELCVQNAIQKNIGELCFTDHVDIDYPGEDVFDFNYEKYTRSIDYCRKKYYGKIKINRGIELGLQAHIIERNVEFLKNKEFDFIIGSLHAANRKELYGGDFYRGKDKQKAYAEYFEYLYRNINLFNDFDVLGHLDIVKRYGDYEDNSLSYKDYKEYIDQILKKIISLGKGIEVNTSGKRYSLDSNHPSEEILMAYRNLGGEIITTGSDSHRYEHLAYGFDETYELLRHCGFKYVTIFRNRKPVQNKI